ncbi:MAG: sulfatase [Bryobacterales bacterium]|nr:sulfatase [Bryobacterales bacterium]MDE0626872.1 sulfatase [Bryobacterales bacterium]
MHPTLKEFSAPIAALVLAAFATCSPGQSPDADARRPNIIFLLLDDMGYADLGAYGNTYHRTPTIDRLAAEGVRFTNAYAAAPNCSPTRASILTGRWPARTGITQYLPGNFLPYARMLQSELPVGLPLDETILAEPLEKAGYSTACVGKWHLGGGDYRPDQRGFGESFTSGHLGPGTMFAPFQFTVPGVKDGDYLTDVLTDAAEGFIERNWDTPFFLYMSYYSVHSPIQAKPELIDAYAGRNDPSGRENAVYAAMVEGVDRSVQRLMAKLEHLGLEENTAVFFFSDNGGVPRRAFNGGFRSGKGYLWEGGIREPLIVRWPGTVQPGSVEDTPVTSIDFYPTILEMAGAADVPGHTIDGVSLVPLLEGTGTIDRPTLFWHYPHYSNAGSTPMGAIRKGSWKLLEFFEDSHVELYNLETDPAETTDLARTDSGRARSMREELAAWRDSVGARLPAPNPEFDPARERQRSLLRYKFEWDPTDPLRPPR